MPYSPHKSNSRNGCHSHALCTPRTSCWVRRRGWCVVGGRGGGSPLGGWRSWGWECHPCGTPQRESCIAYKKTAAVSCTEMETRRLPVVPGVGSWRRAFSGVACLMSSEGCVRSHAGCYHQAEMMPPAMTQYRFQTRTEFRLLNVPDRRSNCFRFV